MLTVGTYTRRGSEGIYRLDFDEATGTLSGLRLLVPLRNPSFQALHPTQPWLYSVCEAEEAGAVAAIALDGDNGRLLNHESARGAGLCHVMVDPSGRCIVSANYRGGNVVVHPLAADGSLRAASDLVQHAGTGPIADRQEGPHAHSANCDPSGRFVIAADLGTDRLMIYALDAEQGKLTPHGTVVVEPGAGPRHFTFHPSGRWAYLITELGVPLGRRGRHAGGLPDDLHTAGRLRRRKLLCRHPCPPLRALRLRHQSRARQPRHFRHR